MNNLKNDKSQAFNDLKSNINFIDLFRELHPDVKLKHTGIGSWICCSPFREDKNPSLQIDKDHSFDHGTKEKLDIIDLYERKFGVNRETAIKNLSKRAGLDRKPSKKGKIVATYDYTDENGELLYQKVRYEPKSFSQRRPDPDQPGRWITKEVFKNIGHVPYHLTELINSDTNSPIIITEGEKDADTAHKLDFLGTTLGSKADASKYFSDPKIQKYFMGRIVWLIADKDIPNKNEKPENKRKIRGGGYKEFRKVAQALAPICKEIRLFVLPGKNIKDLTDFVSIHGDQSKQLVERLAIRAPIYINRVNSEPAQETKKVKSKKPENPSSAQLLYQCFQDLGWKLFFDQSAERWASVKINGHYENIAVGSRRFKRLLRMEYWALHGNGVTAPTIEQIVDVALGKIEYTQPPFPLHVRMAWNTTKDKILIDSGRPDWSIYEIGPDGWTITQTDQSPFKRARKTAAYSCAPDTPRAKWDNLFEFLRVSNDQQKTIIKMWLCLALFPDTARPGLVINGPAGSAKTTIGKRLKGLIDPATNDLPNKFRKNDDDMIAPLANYAVSFLDNANTMTPEQSDLLCLSITGLDNEKRALFTDGDIHNTELMATWIITGVNNPGKMSDFLSRVFLLETALIPEDQKIADGKIDELATKYTPGIQALIFDCMSAALKNISTIESKKLHRLAQANLYSLAMAESLGLNEDRITEVWSQNRDEQQAEVSSGEILTELIPEFLGKNYGKWEGTPSELHEEMFKQLDIEKRSYKKSFPNSAVHLTRRTNKIIEYLHGLGIIICNKRDATRIRQIYNTKTFTNGNPFEKEKVEIVPDPKKVVRPPQFNREQVSQATLSDQETTSCNKCNHYQGSDSCGYSDGLADPENCPMTQPAAQEEIPW